jgi:hypothetical protein
MHANVLSTFSGMSSSTGGGGGGGGGRCFLLDVGNHVTLDACSNIMGSTGRQQLAATSPTNVCTNTLFRSHRLGRPYLKLNRTG